MKLSEVLHYYLPYKLKCQYEGQVNTNDSFEMVGIDEDWANFIFTDAQVIEDVFPILIPLSSIDDNFFTEWNIDLSSEIQIKELRDWYIVIDEIRVSTLKLCLEKHIDIFNLIPEGLAIEKK